MDVALSQVFPTGVTGALLIAGLAILTGGLHLDGLMDTCDGVFNRGDPERRLEIMRDSRVGAFGVVGLAALLLVKYGALVSLPVPVSYGWWEASGTIPLRASALILMTTTARVAMAYCVVCFPYARSAGLGQMFRGGRRAISLSINTVLLVALAYLLLGILGVIGLLASAAAVWLGALYVMTKIPGLTGDVYGALGELAEVVVLLVLVAGR